MLYMLWVAVGWVALSVLAAQLARDKGRSFGAWLVLALLFSPFVALLALCAAVPVVATPPAAAPVVSRD
jgi:hypothetical protein